MSKSDRLAILCYVIAFSIGTAAMAIREAALSNPILHEHFWNGFTTAIFVIGIMLFAGLIIFEE